jgi:hypothetical protein
LKLPHKLEEPVTWRGLLLLLAGYAAFNLTAVGLGIARAEDAARAAELATRATVSAMERRVETKLEATDAGVAELRKDVKAIYDFLLTRQRQPRLEAASK